MKLPFQSSLLPDNALLLLCSNHEQRCLGIVTNRDGWCPRRTVLFKYEDATPLGEKHHALMVQALGNGSDVKEIPFEESNVIHNFDSHKNDLQQIFVDHGDNPVVVDVSVLTKRHLLLLLCWLDDHGCWDRLWIVYSEPEEYEIEGQLPLSFGVSSVTQLPGFTASPNPSRPLHAAMFLGYEGDRAFATYEILEPQKTTVIIPDPPFKEAWRGRTEQQNQNLLASIDQYSLECADSIDPESSVAVLYKVFGDPTLRSDFARTLCPLGTKPQTLGAYMYLRQCVDTPSVIYSGALRHNHSYYSSGVGRQWLIHQPK